MKQGTSWLTTIFIDQFEGSMQWKPKMAARGCEPNTVVSWAPIGEWIVSICFMTCCKIWHLVCFQPRNVWYPQQSWHGHSTVSPRWHDMKTKLAWLLLQRYCMKSASSRNQIDCPTQQAKCVMIHTAAIADCTHGNGAKHIFVSNAQYLDYNEQ